MKDQFVSWAEEVSDKCSVRVAQVYVVESHYPSYSCIKLTASRFQSKSRDSTSGLGETRHAAGK